MSDPSVVSKLTQSVDAQMPALTDELTRLVGIPSVSEWGFPAHTRPAVLQAHDVMVELLTGAGVQQIRALELPGTAPIITGTIPGPQGAPTVLLYGHYDVVGAGEESEWLTPPFEATRRGEEIFGRGVADSKSNLLVHIGALRPGTASRREHQGVIRARRSAAPRRAPGRIARALRADAILVADGAASGRPALDHRLIRGTRSSSSADAGQQ